MLGIVEYYCSWCGIRLCYDAVHDEVYLADTGLVILCNGRWCFSDDELWCILYDYSVGKGV